MLSVNELCVYFLHQQLSLVCKLTVTYMANFTEDTIGRGQSSCFTLEL